MNDGFCGWLIIVGLIVFVMCIPCKYDPAIRIKEWAEGWRTKGRR